MPIGPGEVARIAALAQLELDPPALETFRRQLQSILDYVRLLDELDVSSIQPDPRAIEDGQLLRPDEPGPSLTVGQALANAPDAGAGMFRVPRVIQAPLER